MKPLGFPTRNCLECLALGIVLSLGFIQIKRREMGGGFARIDSERQSLKYFGRQKVNQQETDHPLPGSLDSIGSMCSFVDPSPAPPTYSTVQTPWPTPAHRLDHAGAFAPPLPWLAGGEALRGI